MYSVNVNYNWLIELYSSINTLVHIENREKGKVKIVIEKKGEVMWHYSYTCGVAQSIHENKVNVVELAGLVELTELPCLKEMGLRLTVKVTITNGMQRTANMDLPEHIMATFPSRLRELGAEEGEE